MDKTLPVVCCTKKAETIGPTTVFFGTNTDLFAVVKPRFF